jgi:Starch-binding associating with outer membrane
MKNLKYILSLLAIVFAANACQKFDDLEADPNRSISVPPSLILRAVLRDMYYAPWDDETKWGQFWCTNYNYYGNNEYWTGATSLRFTQLKDVQKMEAEAKAINLPEVNAYSAVGKFLRAYYYYDMTMKVGDVPLREALQGEGNTAPVYDAQKDIFKQVLAWLEAANTDLGALAGRGVSAETVLQGDIYFNGDLKKWQKTVNTFRLRVLAQMSKKETEGDMNLKAEFGKLIADAGRYPLQTGLGDNLAFIYNSVTDKYPTNPDNFGFDAVRNNLSATHIGLLGSLKDPRVFVVAEPAEEKIKSGLTARDHAAYVGAPFDEGLDAMTAGAQGGKYSLIGRKRYYSGYTAENCIQIGYPEMCFNIAEGINRGWAAGNAKDWYEKGIAASMTFFGIGDAKTLSDYMAQTEVNYKGNNADGLKQILTQKYLAFFQNSGLEAYYNWRRTNTPAFKFGGPGTGNSGVIPRRFQYPTSERDNNTANYKAALLRQFGKETDSVNDDLWIVK